jgi:hypothetical protein
MSAYPPRLKPARPLPLGLYATPGLSLVTPSVEVGKRIERYRAERAAECTAEGVLKRKAERASELLDRLAARSARLAAEIKQLQKRKACVDARGERIENRFLDEMRGAGLEAFFGLTHTFTAKPNPASLAVDHEAKVPTEYRRGGGWAPDKAGMKAALAQRAGESDADYDARIAPILACAHLEQTVSLVRK